METVLQFARELANENMKSNDKFGRELVVQNTAGNLFRRKRVD